MPCATVRCGTVRCYGVLCRAFSFEQTRYHKNVPGTMVCTYIESQKKTHPAQLNLALLSSAQLSSAQRSSAAERSAEQRRTVPCPALPCGVLCRAIPYCAVPCCAFSFVHTKKNMYEHACGVRVVFLERPLREMPCIYYCT